MTVSTKTKDKTMLKIAMMLLALASTCYATDSLTTDEYGTTITTMEAGKILKQESYTQTGQLEFKVFYANGVKQTSFAYDDDGNVASCWTYYPSGEVKSRTGFYGDNERIDRTYYQSGTLRSVTRFVNGKTVSTTHCNTKSQCQTISYTDDTVYLAETKTWGK